MVFVVCCLAKEGCSLPIKDWFGCTLAVDLTLDKLYDEFCNGKFDDDPIEYDNRSTLSYVKVGASKSISSLTKVSPCSSVIDVEKSLGSFVMFVVPSDRPVLHAAGVTNAFSVLMKNARTKSRSLPPQFSEQRHPQKSKLKNDILQWLESKGLGWSPDAVQSLGCTFVNTIADAMWYIDQNHATLASRGNHVPDIFHRFSGYRRPGQQKKRKIDHTFLQQDELKARASALYNLALASYLKQDSWKDVCVAVLSLADSLMKYAKYLSSQNKRVSIGTSVWFEKVVDSLLILVWLYVLY